MRKYIYLTLLLLICTSAFAQYAPPIEFTEVDGSPSTFPYKVIFQNDSITDNGDGTITINIAAVAVTPYNLLIDDTHYLLIDDTNQLRIQ